MLRKIPRGKLMVIGGAEDKGISGDVEISSRIKQFEPMEILKVLIPKKKRKPHVEIITTASSIPDEINQMYKTAFRNMGLKKVGFINMGNHPEARNAAFIARIKKADAVLFSGGDQYRLSTILGNTDVLDAVMERYLNDKDFIVAGTSAGAMAIASLMMFEGEDHEAILKGTVKISSGLGFLEGCIIDTHFRKRGRFGRLAQAVVMNPTCVGMGIGEDTALIVKKGREMKCIGSGMVIIIDSRPVGHTNISYADEYTPVCIEGLKVHILCKGSGYNLDERRFIPSTRDLREEKSRAVKSKKHLGILK